MVVVHRMTKFVQEDKITQMFRKTHQVEAQRNGISTCATPPLGAGSTNRHPLILQPREAGQPLQACRQVGLGLTTQRLDIDLLGGVFGTAGRHTPLGRLDPRTALLIEAQGTLTAHPYGMGQDHLARRFHRKDDAAGTAGGTNGQLVQLTEYVGVPPQRASRQRRPRR